MGSYAIVGAHLPIAVGAAWSAQYRGVGQVAVCFFGDGTTNIGAFHEALNLAAVWKAPVVFVCENNQYMEYTPIGSVTAVERPAADRAAAYGLEPLVVDGNDVEAVYAMARRDDRPGACRRGPVARRGDHLPPRRPLASRPGHLPAGGRGQGLAGPRPDPGAAARLRRGRRRGGRAGRARGGGARRRSTRPRRSRARRPTRTRRVGDDPALGRWRLRMAEMTYRQAVARGIAQEMERDPIGRHARRGHRRGGRRLQDDRGAAGDVRSRARARHADQRAGDHRCRHGRRDDRAAAGGRADVQRLLRRRVGHGRQPDRQDPLHDRRPGGAAARHPHRQRRRAAVRRAALAVASRTGRWPSRA